MNELLKFTIIITIVILVAFVVLVCVFTLAERIRNLESKDNLVTKKEVKK